MSALLARVRAAFVAPSASGAVGRAPATQAAQRTAPMTLGVLAGGSDAAVAGAAVALAAARRGGASCAVVCRWTGEEPGPSDAVGGGAGPAVPPARRLAGRLAARGLAVVARGRLVDVRLPADASQARAAAERAVAATDGLPVVLVVAGPRPPAFDALLAAQDRLIVAASEHAPQGLRDLAVEGAAAIGRGTGVLRHVPTAADRLAARVGLWSPSGLRTAADRALDGHG